MKGLGLSDLKKGLVFFKEEEGKHFPMRPRDGVEGDMDG